MKTPSAIWPRRVARLFAAAGSISGIVISIAFSSGSHLARAADPALNVYCAPGTAPTCFGVSLSTAPDGAGGTEVTLRLSNLQGASGFPITLPPIQPSWSRLYRVDIQGPDDGTFATDNQSSGVALSLAGGATSIGDTSMTWGIVPLDIETGLARGFAVGTDISTSGAEIIGCNAPPDLGYPSISTCAASGTEPEVSLQFATRTAWNAGQVTLTLLFQDPTGEYACRVSELAGLQTEPLRCERLGGPVVPPPQQSQSLSFVSVPPAPAYVGVSYAAQVTASSGLTSTLGTSTPATCTVSGSIVSLVGAGHCVVTADQPGNATFLPAPQVTQEFSIVRRSQEITFSLPTGGIVGTSVPLAATGGASGNAVTFSSGTPSTCTVSGSSLALTQVGVCTVIANQSGSEAFDAAAPKSADIAVTMATWNFTGFLWPVRDLPSINVARAGLVIPIRFGVGGDRGSSVFSDDSPRSAAVPCTGSGGAGPSLPTSSLANIPVKYVSFTDRYFYAWKTERSWAGSCRLFTIDLADGSSYSARFDFRPR